MELEEFGGTVKTSAYNFYGKPENFIDRAANEGLELVSMTGTDLVFQLKQNRPNI